MFQKCNLIFKRIRKNIDNFLSEYKTMPPGPLSADYEGAYERYRELVSDPEFNDRLKELRFLETIILQVKAIHSIQPIFYYATPTDKPFLYVRAPFAKRLDVQNQMKRSLGYSDDYPKSVNKIAEDSPLYQYAIRVLKKAMMEEYIMYEYQLKYPIKWLKKH